MQQIVTSVSRVDPTLPVNDLLLVRDVVTNNVFLDRMISTLTAALALLATLLAGIGLYGTLAYSVSQRTREMGIKLALGAAPAALRAEVLTQVGRLALIGGGVGLAVAVYLGIQAEALLFDITPLNPVVLVAAAAIVTAVVIAAGIIPARRAARIAPMEALRYE
jgi:ABC-type antimicrobial peptide transport system permease subunit